MKIAVSGGRLAVLLLCLYALCSAAQQEIQIGELSELDRQFMAQQRELLAELAAVHLGRQFSGRTDNDLDIMQSLFDRDLVRPQQTRELQAMGVVLGDLLASDLDMHWVIYRDKVGRSRALRYRDSDNILFPVTMISRRRAVGNLTPVREIYRKAYDTVDAAREPLPFSAPRR